MPEEGVERAVDLGGISCSPAVGGGGAAGRLLSSSVDGSVSEWDLFHLQQKVVLFARSLYISIFFVKSDFRIVNLACMC